MSIALSDRSSPKNLVVSVIPSNDLRSPLKMPIGSGGTVRIGDHVLTMTDFLCVARHALLAIPLEGEKDPRRAFVRVVKELELELKRPPEHHNKVAPNPEKEDASEYVFFT